MARRFRRPLPGQTPAKGARRVYRPLKTMAKMSKADVDAVVRQEGDGLPCRPSGSCSQRARRAMGGNRGPSTGWLAGKSFTLRYDNAPAMEYRVDDAENLNWRKEGDSGWTKARYQAWESTPGVDLVWPPAGRRAES